MAKNPRMAVLDFASREAKRSQYCSRAAVKLEQLLLKFPKVLSSLDKQKGKVVKCVDLGCHPGSWLQVLSRKIKKAEIYGFDLNEIESLESLKYVDVHRTRTFQCDVFESDELMNSLQLDKNVNLLTSDMMAKTTGQNDASASHELAVRAFELATKDLLAKDAHFVCKIFESEETRALKMEAKKAFASASLFRPDAVRKGSREIYMVGVGFKG
jgi:23S rRNA (uridine2552-2'-O)-methyltransferase